MHIPDSADVFHDENDAVMTAQAYSGNTQCPYYDTTPKAFLEAFNCSRWCMADNDDAPELIVYLGDVHSITSLVIWNDVTPDALKNVTYVIQYKVNGDAWLAPSSFGDLDAGEWTMDPSKGFHKVMWYVPLIARSLRLLVQNITSGCLDIEVHASIAAGMKV